jgi:hypothetical protein
MGLPSFRRYPYGNLMEAIRVVLVKNRMGAPLKPKDGLNGHQS